MRGARLADTVAKLNARLEQLTSGRPAEHARHAAAEPLPSGDAPPTAPDSFDIGIDQAVAEIEARQRALEEAPVAAAAPQPMATPAQPAPASADFSSLERQLHHITAQIETLRRPSGVEDAVTALRADLADIAHAINEALPRRALESLQSDVHTLAERIDHGHGHGGDPSALDRIERDLAQVHAALNAMTPAEGLGDFNARIDELSRKMDGISGGSPDPEMLRYLEAAINELRELSAGVASAEGVASLAGDVQALSARIDHIAETTGATGLDSLAHRVSELTQALDSRVAEMGPMPQHLESLVQVAHRQAQPLRLGLARSGGVRASGAPDRGDRRADRGGRAEVRRPRRDRARHPAIDPAGARGARGCGRHRRACRALGRGRSRARRAEERYRRAGAQARS